MLFIYPNRDVILIKLLCLSKDLKFMRTSDKSGEAKLKLVSKFCGHMLQLELYFINDEKETNLN